MHMFKTQPHVMESSLNAIVYGTGKCNENGSPF